jgi:fucose permease
MATKTSILVFYLRLSKDTQKVLRFTSWLTLIIVNLAGTILTLLNIFQCRPIDSAWDTWNDDDQCIPLLTEFICAAPINIITDLAILALPIPVLTSMRLPTRTKTILILTFGLGIFVTVVDVVRIHYLQQALFAVPDGGIDTDAVTKFGGQAEFAWYSSFALMWSAVEVNVGMTCACIPTLKPLIIKILPAMLFDPDGSTFGSRSDKDFSTESPPTNNTNNFQGQISRVSTGAVSPLGSPKPPADEDQDPDVSFMDFLRSQDSGSSSARQDDRRGTVSTQYTTTTTTTRGRRESAVYFGFVNMNKPKSMLKCNAAESFRYCTVVTILFVLWGASYGLLNTLNNVVAVVAGMTTAQTLGLTSAYFGFGYLFGPLLVGEWILRRDEHYRIRKRKGGSEAETVGGFKVTFIVGLCFYGVGTIIFWPSAATVSWGGFMVSNFAVGFGLSVLETGANSFLILCGPLEYGEARLLVAQGIQAVGSIVSGILAQKVFFAGIDAGGKPDSMTLLNVQWTYLAVTLICVILALFFYYMPLPEVSDGELDRASKMLPVDPKKKSLGGLQLRTWSLILAVIAQYTYVAAQEDNSIFVADLIRSLLPADGIGADPGTPAALTLSISDYLSIAHAAFAFSRFLAGYLAYLSVSNPRIPKPRTMLAITVAGSVICALLTVVLRPSNPNLIIIPIVLFYFFEGPCWPLIFAMGLRGQGRRTKRAAAFITMGASGPAFFPFIMYAIIKSGKSVRIGFIVVLALQVCTGVYPLFLESVTGARAMVDPKKNPIQHRRGAIHHPHTHRATTTATATVMEELAEEEEEDVDVDVNQMVQDQHRRDHRRNTSTGTTHSFNILSKAYTGLGAKLGHKRTESSIGPTDLPEVSEQARPEIVTPPPPARLEDEQQHGNRSMDRA